MSAALPLYIVPVNKFQINFVDQSRRLQRVARPFASQETLGLPVKLVIN